MRRVVITGLGALSSVGIGIAAHLNAFRSGTSGMRKINSINTDGFSTTVGFEVQQFDPYRWIRNIDPRTIGRSAQLAVAASRMALGDAGIEVESLLRGRCGVSIGTCDADLPSIEPLISPSAGSLSATLTRQLARQLPAQRLAFSVAREFDLPGAAITIGTACAAGNYAIGYAYDSIVLGESDLMLCGGAESISRKNFAGFSSVRAMAPERCQPFDANRKGMLMGEGSGVLVLESLESARSRRARIYAEVLGYGLNCDASNPVAPNVASIAECMRIAHRNARIEPLDVDYICAHGTGTVTNDSVESAAIRDVFGNRIPAISSVKSMIGHTLGAASALGSIACAVALGKDFIPPTINHRRTDPACGVDCVPNTMRATRLRVVQNNGFAFGGNNAITIYGRYDDEERSI